MVIKNRNFNILLYFKSIGYINIYRILYLKFLKIFLKKKIIKLKTPYKTIYNIFNWDTHGSGIFVRNCFAEWGAEYAFIHSLKKRKKEVFLDVGCHTGYYSCLYNNFFSKTIGFEPSIKCEEALDLLKIQLNNFIYYQRFLGNQKKDVTSNQYEDGYAFFDKVKNKRFRNIIERKKIKITTLDDLIFNNHYNDKISAIKIDVDGIDLDVLKGGIKIIKKYRPSIMIENQSEELISIMSENDYKCFTFVSSTHKPYNLTLKEVTKINQYSFHTNTICVPTEYVTEDFNETKFKGDIFFGQNKEEIMKKFS